MDRPAPYFVSYAQHDTKMVLHLLGQLAPHLAASRTYKFTKWQDRDVLIGEGWHDAIVAELERHRIALLMVTPTFLVRPYILTEELPRILAPGKIVLPVLLKPIDLGRQDAHGIEDLSIFAHRVSGHERRAYSQCSPQQRELFAIELFRAIESRLDRDF